MLVKRKFSDVMRNFKETAEGFDGINPKAPKAVRHDIITPVLHLANLSFSQGFFPR